MKMHTFRSDYVDAQGVPGLHSLLKEWKAACAEYVDQMKSEDSPFYYNEVAMTGFLAAGAWRCKGVALQEYRTTKGRLLEHRWTGRCDLYVYLKPHQFIFECKFYRTNLARYSKESFQHIKERLAEASRDAKQHRLPDGERLGVCFVAPFLSRKVDHLQSILPGWCDSIRQIKHRAIAWTFPNSARRLKGDWKHDFPGVVALIR